MDSLLAAKGLILASVVSVIALGLRESGIYQPAYPVVETLNGQVRGVISVSRDGREYAAFVGIPYAKAPVGELRFEAPKPAEPWDGILDANRYAPDCYQYDAMVKGRYEGDEDCLFLNAYSPSPNINASLPVMVWIHGGAFLTGGAKLYSPSYLMDEDVVVVSMNYRLGPFGFLNTGDELIRGNMGLKDQNMAIHWVKANIKNFGGDPNKITIFGESAGAASVHYHVVSPASKGLFQKAIIQSGAITCPWSYASDSAHNALKFGERVGCSTENTSALVSCLKQLSPKELVLPIIDIMRDSPLFDPEISMVPSKEEVVHEDTFLSDNPRILIQQGKFTKVPLMFGMTSGEGGLRTSRLEANNKVLNSIDEKWNDFCPILQYYDPSKTDVSQKIKERYIGKGTFLEDPNGFLKNFNRMISDGMFFHGLHNAAAAHAKYSPVHMYYYNYNATLPSVYSLMMAVTPDDWILTEINVAYFVVKNFLRKYLGYSGPHEYGPSHADDLFQVWKMQWPFQIGQGSSDYEFSRNFVKSLVNFAKDEKILKFNGVLWPPIEINNIGPFKYMQLDEVGSVIDEPFADRLPFWDSLNIRNP